MAAWMSPVHYKRRKDLDPPRTTTWPGAESDPTPDLDAKLDSAQRALVTLKAGNIRLDETALGNLDINGKGDIRQQAVTLALDGPQLKLNLALDGQLAKGDWRGRLAEGVSRPVARIGACRLRQNCSAWPAVSLIWAPIAGAPGRRACVARTSG